MLKTRHREQILFNACLEAKQPVVIDNTNPSLEDRQRYIKPAQEKKFQIIGYYFESKIKDCKIRNSQRQGKKLFPSWEFWLQPRN
ncbi:MAG: AAA family ATPase [Xenococcus sp. MO_188.B8]|nr:AAA family ATPase [Xenococcus sp. MO_188.B8]